MQGHSGSNLLPVVASNRCVRLPQLAGHMVAILAGGMFEAVLVVGAGSALRSSMPDLRRLPAGECTVLSLGIHVEFAALKSKSVSHRTLAAPESAPAPLLRFEAVVAVVQYYISRGLLHHGLHRCHRQTGDSEEHHGVPLCWHKFGLVDFSQLFIL